MLLGAFVHTMAYYVGLGGAVAIAVLVVVPALFFYGWRRTGQLPPTAQAMKAWLVGRTVVVACGACLVGAALLALQWIVSAEEENVSWQNPGSLLTAWGMSFGLFVLGLALVFLGAWACGKIYNALCNRHEGRRVAFYELGILFGIAVFAQLINLIVLTIVGPAPVPQFEDTPLAMIPSTSGGPPPAELARIGGGNIPVAPPSGNSEAAPAQKQQPAPEQKSEQEPEQKPQPEDAPAKQPPPSAAGRLLGLSIPSQAPETFWGKAGYLVFRGYPQHAWQYAWAAYLLEENAQIKSAAKWCGPSQRPGLLMPRLAVGVVPEENFSLRGEEGRRLLGAFSMVELAGALVEVINHFDLGPGNVPWVAYVKEQKSLEDLFQAAREVNADVVMALRVWKKRRGNRQELEMQCQLLTVGESQPVWSSRKVTTSQYQAMKRQGTNLLREVERELMTAFNRHFSLSQRPALAREEVPEYLEQLYRNNQVPVIEKVAVVKYLAEHELLSPEQTHQAVLRITGKELEISQPNESLKKWVQEQLPPLPVR